MWIVHVGDLRLVLFYFFREKSEFAFNAGMNYKNNGNLIHVCHNILNKLLTIKKYTFSYTPAF